MHWKEWVLANKRAFFRWCHESKWAHNNSNLRNPIYVTAGLCQRRFIVQKYWFKKLDAKSLIINHSEITKLNNCKQATKESNLSSVPKVSSWMPEAVSTSESSSIIWWRHRFGQWRSRFWRRREWFAQNCPRQMCRATW